MSTPAPSGAVAPAPFEVYSVHFDFPTGQAIKLVDSAVRQPNPNLPVTLGATPEWSATGRNEVAAYVRNTRPDVRVVFRGVPGTHGTYTVGANSALVQIEERQVVLTFDPVDGRSAAEVFRAQASRAVR